MARVKFTGHTGIRRIESPHAPGGAYVWSEENDWTQNVTDPQLLEDLQTYPYDQWQFLADRKEQPPAARPIVAIAGIGPGRAGELAGHGINAVGDLAQLDEEGIEELASNSGASRGQIRDWVAQARTIAGVEAGSEVDNG